MKVEYKILSESQKLGRYVSLAMLQGSAPVDNPLWLCNVSWSEDKVCTMNQKMKRPRSNMIRLLLFP